MVTCRVLLLSPDFQCYSCDPGSCPTLLALLVITGCPEKIGPMFEKPKNLFQNDTLVKLEIFHCSPETELPKLFETHPIAFNCSDCGMWINIVSHIWEHFLGHPVYNVSSSERRVEIKQM